ncbi:MAG: hypothetical protein WDM79_11580 [Terricaulis sp.]
MYRVLIFAAALAACSPPAPTPAPEAPPAAETAAPAAAENETMDAAWAAARAEGIDFRAVGQEPGWMLDIYRENQIKLMWDYGEHEATFPLSPPNTSQEGATQYTAQADGHTLAVTIRRFPCSDAMSGQAYPSTVSVVIDGRTLEGCGRSV